MKKSRINLIPALMAGILLLQLPFSATAQGAILYEETASEPAGETETVSESEVATDAEDEILPEFPDLVSDKLVVMDADTGEVLYQLNGDVQCYPASTTKLLTALLTIENCAMDEVVTYSKAAVDSIKTGDANASISEGEELTVEQSLYCLLLRSANDAAYGLAEHTAGSVSAFAAMMNARAELLGCTGTHFSNASGLHDEFHYSTPYDMALIARECMQNKTLMGILNYTKVYTIPPTNMSSFTRYYSHRYAMVGNGAYAYPYSLGGKTGYTDNAKSCLISFAEKDGLRLIVVIMESTDDGRYEDTIALFDYYFNNFHKIYLSDVNTGLTTDSDSVLALTEEISSSHNVSVGFDEDTYLLVPNAFDAEDLTGIVTYADSAAYVGKEGGFACISYYVDNLNVGNATLYLTEYSLLDSSGLSGVPVRSHRTLSEDSGLVYINIWYLVAGFAGACLLGGLIFLIVYRYRHRRGRNQKRKLRF